MSDEGDSKFEPFEARQWRRYTRYPFLLAKFVLFAGIAAAVYWSLSSVGNVLFPVVFSFILAYLLDPLIDWFEERGIKRTLGIVVVIFSGLGAVALFALFLYPTIVSQVQKVVEQIPKLIELIQTKTIPWVERTFDYKLPATISEGVQKYGESLTNYLPTLAQRAGTWLTDIATGTGAFVAWLLNLVMIPIFSFYFLRDFDHIRLKFHEFIPEHRRNVVLDRLGKMDEVIGEWVRGQMQVAGMLAVLYAIGLSIAFSLADIDINSGIAIGILSGLLNFIPYFGVFVGIILSVLIVVINWSGFVPLLAVGLVFVIVQSLEGYLITPKIVGEKVGLSPVTVIIVLLIGGELYGLTGILIAIPIFGALKVLFPDIVRYYKKTPFFTGRKVMPGGREEGSAPDDPPEDPPAGETDGTVESAESGEILEGTVKADGEAEVGDEAADGEETEEGQGADEEESTERASEEAEPDQQPPESTQEGDEEGDEER